MQTSTLLKVRFRAGINNSQNYEIITKLTRIKHRIASVSGVRTSGFETVNNSGRSILIQECWKKQYPAKAYQLFITFDYRSNLVTICFVPMVKPISVRWSILDLSRSFNFLGAKMFLILIALAQCEILQGQHFEEIVRKLD